MGNGWQWWQKVGDSGGLQMATGNMKEMEGDGGYVACGETAGGSEG